MKKCKLLFALIFLCHGYLFSQNLNITGKVTGRLGENLTRVTVTVSSSKQASVTDDNGNYAISVPANDTLTFTSVGYLPQNIPVEARTVIDVKLEPDANNLDDVIVTALGIRKETKRL